MLLNSKEEGSIDYCVIKLGFIEISLKELLDLAYYSYSF